MPQTTSAAEVLAWHAQQLEDTVAAVETKMRSIRSRRRVLLTVA